MSAVAEPVAPSTRAVAIREWSWMRLGLSFLFLSVIVGLITNSLLFVTQDMTEQERKASEVGASSGKAGEPASPGGPQEPSTPVKNQFLVIFQAATGVSAGAFGLCLLVGLGLCCTIPARAQARAWVLGLLACVGFAVLLGVLLTVMRLRAGQDPQSAPVVAVTAALGVFALGGSFCLAMLLRAAARANNDSDLGLRFLILFGVYWAGALVFWGLVAVVLALGKGWDREAVYGCGALTFQVAVSVWALMMLARLREALPSPVGVMEL